MTAARPSLSLHDPLAARQAGRDALSLALLDARNATLRWLGRFEESVTQAARVTPPDGSALRWPVVARCIGRAGWFQEFWTARHLQRSRGARADPAAMRLPSIHRRADDWFAPPVASARPPSTIDPAAEGDAPDASVLRQYLSDTLELTLDLLHGAPETDDGLHVFRLALLHEDRMAERLAVEAQWAGVDPGPHLLPLGPVRPAVDRPSIWLPSGLATLGTSPGGLVPPAERWAHSIQVPECDIDARAVSWARFAEFVDDGGYDEPRWWSAEGWQWLQRDGRRSPRGVAQWRGGVSVERFGAVCRSSPAQVAVHVTWYEAQAWCAWAGRRLPTEGEWSRAQFSADRTGFVWGEVLEWMLGPPRPWSDDRTPVAGFSAPLFSPEQAVLRGACLWTPPRAAHPQSRRFVAPTRDGLFCGFRSCAP